MECDWYVFGYGGYNSLDLIYTFIVVNFLEHKEGKSKKKKVEDTKS